MAEPQGRMARDRVRGPRQGSGFRPLCWGSHGRPGLARYGLIHALAAEQRLDSCEGSGTQEPAQEGTQAAQGGQRRRSTNQQRRVRDREASGTAGVSPGPCGRSAVGAREESPRGLPDFMGLTASRKCHYLVTSQVAQRPRLQVFNAGGPEFHPGFQNQILHARTKAPAYCDEDQDPLCGD